MSIFLSNANCLINASLHDKAIGDASAAQQLSSNALDTTLPSMTTTLRVHGCIESVNVCCASATSLLKFSF